MSRDVLSTKELTREGVRQVILNESYPMEDLPLVGEAHLKGQAELTDTGVILWGHVWAESEEPCDRCSQPFRRSLRESFQDRFVYQSLIDEAYGGERELMEEDFYDIIGPDGLVDLKDLARQYLVLALSADRVCEAETCEVPAGF